MKNANQETVSQSTRKNPDILGPTTSPESREAVYAVDPTQSAFYYLSSYFRNAPDLTIAIEEIQKAFIYGYVCALHKSHTLNAALFLHGQELIHYIESEVDQALSVDRSAHLLKATELAQPIDKYLFNIIEGCNAPGTDMPEAFLTGYKSAFICNNKFDRCLFMYGHLLHCEVLAAMLSYQQSEENARRAAARIVFNKYATNNTTFRPIVRNDQHLNDDGQLVDHD